MRRLLNLKLGIMEQLYQEWLSRENGFFDELRGYACDELKVISELGNSVHKEGEDGTGIDKVA